MPRNNNLKSIQFAVKSFLEKNTRRTIASSGTDLVKSGIISSLIMFELIDFIEKKFNVDVDVLSIVPDNFNSLKKIAKQITVWMLK